MALKSWARVGSDGVLKARRKNSRLGAGKETEGMRTHMIAGECRASEGEQEDLAAAKTILVTNRRREGCPSRKKESAGDRVW